MNYHVVVSPREILGLIMLAVAIIAILVYFIKLSIEDWYKKFKKRKR